MGDQILQPTTCATFCQSQNLHFNPRKNDKKEGGKEDEAKCRWLFIMSTTLWASRAKRKTGVGELNKLLFIEELNAVEYFSASGEVAKYLPMKSTQHTHAKMKRTAVSL